MKRTAGAAAALAALVAASAPARAGVIQFEDVYLAPDSHPGDAGAGARLSSSARTFEYAHVFDLPEGYEILSASITFEGWDNNGGNESISVFYDADIAPGFTLTNFANGGADVVSRFVDEFALGDFRLLRDGLLEVRLARNSGGFTFLGSTLRIAAATAPEPGALALFAGAALLAAGMRRRAGREPGEAAPASPPQRRAVRSAAGPAWRNR